VWALRVRRRPRSYRRARWGSDQRAGISSEDQSGDGSTVVIDTVSSPQGGFVVSGPGGTVLGSAQLRRHDGRRRGGAGPAADGDHRPAGELRAGTGGDGESDADQPVPAPVPGTDEDDEVPDATDPVEDDAERPVG